MIGIVDYGLGNIQAFINIYKQLGVAAETVDSPEKLRSANKIILPGVGAFDWAMARLNQSGLRETLDELVLEKGIDVLGVCVGMQIMAQRSEEGREPGLGWLDAEVKHFDVSRFKRHPHVPHMGWNDATPRIANALFHGLAAPRFYFLHSFYFAPNDPGLVLAETNYGGPFTSAVRSGNICGTQFHPEKSHDWGIQLLKNFAEPNDAST